MPHPTNLAAAILAAALVNPALGSISVDIVPVDNSAALTGYNTFDFQATTLEYDWTGASFLLELTAGSLYQDPGAGMVGGGFLPTNPFFFQWYPAAEFDTSVGTLDGAVLGGSSRVGGDGNLEFSTTRLNVSFYNIANTDIGTFPIGRMTVSEDAVGSWRLRTINAGKHLVDLAGTVTDGVIEIETQMIQVRTLTSVSIVNQTDGTTLLTKSVTDSIRELAGNGFAGSAVYEDALRNIMFNILYDEIDRQQYSQPTEGTALDDLVRITPGTVLASSSGSRFKANYELLTISESEYLQSIASLTASTEASLPEPGTVALLGLGAAALLRRRR